MLGWSTSRRRSTCSTIHWQHWMLKLAKLYSIKSSDPLVISHFHTIVQNHYFDKTFSNSFSFEQAELTGILAGTTRLLVTHNPAVLQFMDSVVVVKDGKISDQGTYTDLVTRGGLAGLLAEGGQEGERDGEGDQRKKEAKVKKEDGPLTEGEADSARITEDEEAMTGEVGKLKT